MLNFNRFPHLVSAVTRSWFAGWIDHYVDDYIEVDTVTNGASCQEAVETVHRCMGQATEPMKRKGSRIQQSVLGVGVSFEDLVQRRGHHRVRAARPIRKHREANSMTPTQAATLYGKVGFILTASWGRVGRAGAQPLVQRSATDTTYKWSAALEYSYLF